MIWDAASKPNPPVIAPGAEIAGSAYAINIGRADALMDKAEVNFCRIVWLPERLPMWRFYNGIKRDLADFFQDEETSETRQVLRSGQYARWLLKTTVPPQYTPDLYLYVIGAVFYRDSEGTRRARLFARRYIPGTQQFEIVGLQEIVWAV